MLVVPHTFMRRSLALVLAHEPDLLLTSQVADIDSAIAETVSGRPDVLVVDQQALERDLADALAALQAQLGAVPIVVLGTGEHALSAGRVLAAGATGYVVKDDAADGLATAVRAAVRERSARAKLSIVGSVEAQT